MNILVVRLGALGDVVHAVPAAAALRQTFPAAQIHWLVEAKHRALVDLVTSIDRTIVLKGSSIASWMAAIGVLRDAHYDIAIDFQGLLKSAVLARASGAARVIGLASRHLRERTARPFYSEVVDVEAVHVVRKNLQLLTAVGAAGADTASIRFPLADVASPALKALREQLPPDREFALINPGAAWPNKRWPAERFGQVASFVQTACGLSPVVLWGPGEEPLARAVVAASSGAARVAPRTDIVDIVALTRAAALLVSGDTGPLHIGAATGTPIVSLFGPTDPDRNGPVSADDVVVSKYRTCGCDYDRRCHEATWCLAEVGVAEVCAAVERRLSTRSIRG